MPAEDVRVWSGSDVVVTDEYVASCTVCWALYMGLCLTVLALVPASGSVTGVYLDVDFEVPWAVSEVVTEIVFCLVEVRYGLNLSSCCRC